MSRARTLYGNGGAMVPRPEKPTKSNTQGYPAYEMGIREQYLQTLMTNTLGHTFYATQKTNVEKSESIHAAMLKEDPAFAAKALVYARNYGYMRTQTVYGLAMLSKVDTELFKSIFNQVIRTPNDLTDFMAIRGKGSRAVKGAIANWMLQKMSEYWAIKYGSAGKQGYSLKDVIKIVHPKGDSVAGKNNLFKYLLGKDYDISELSQIQSFVDLKNAKTAKAKVSAITSGKLPHEVVTPFADSPEVWKALVPNMPIFALLKNLATIERHDAADANKAYIEGVFSNAEIIGKSKILPFRFLEAIDHVSRGWLQDALRDALELSFVNIPDIKGNTAVFLDVSGSMGPGYGHPELLPKAAIFAIALIKKTDNGKLLLFNTSLSEFTVSKRDSMLSQARSINARNGTDTALPFQHILNKGMKFDNIILITDEQQNSGRPMYGVFDDYLRNVNPKTKLFIVDVAPNSHGSVDPKIKNVEYIYGWSDKVLDFIALNSQGWGNMADAIEAGAHLKADEDAVQVSAESDD